MHNQPCLGMQKMTFDIFQNFLTMPEETADISRFSHSPEKEKPPHIMSLLERHPPRHHQFQKQRSMTAMYGTYGNYYGGGYNGMDAYNIPPAYRKISAESPTTLRKKAVSKTNFNRNPYEDEDSLSWGASVV
uniref:Lymphoid enhancer-binding factor 1 n=1 Tax=Steinernema glaseri TaxID=37863 RepID=A0A1I8ABF7_9BILA